MSVSARSKHEHVVIVAYLFPPNEMIAVRRPSGLRNYFEAAGVRTSIITSQISGIDNDDNLRSVIRAADLRVHFKTQYQSLIGFDDLAIAVRASPRRWTRYVVPDVTALSWLPFALLRFGSLIARDRPDAIITTSPPESAHIVGLAAHRAGIRWVADFRDGWLFDPPNPRPALKRIDAALERLVVKHADAITAVNEQIVTDFERRLGARAIHISNAFDPAAAKDATDETATLDPSRFSIVYTGTLGIDMTPGGLGARGADAVTLLEALARLLERDATLRTRVEFVFAGVVTTAERGVLTRGPLADVVRIVGRIPHVRALGLQRAADALLLISGGAGYTTGKLFEYLAAEKPIFALADRPSAVADVLDNAGVHEIVSARDGAIVQEALGNFIERWSRTARFSPRERFDLSTFEVQRMGERMLDVVRGAAQ